MAKNEKKTVAKPASYSGPPVKGENLPPAPTAQYQGPAPDPNWFRDFVAGLTKFDKGLREALHKFSRGVSPALQFGEDFSAIQGRELGPLGVLKQPQAFVGGAANELFRSFVTEDQYKPYQPGDIWGGGSFLQNYQPSEEAQQPFGERFSEAWNTAREAGQQIIAREQPKNFTERLGVSLLYWLNTPNVFWRTYGGYPNVSPQFMQEYYSGVPMANGQLNRPAQAQATLQDRVDVGEMVQLLSQAATQVPRWVTHLPTRMAAQIVGDAAWRNVIQPAITSGGAFPEVPTSRGIQQAAGAGRPNRELLHAGINPYWGRVPAYLKRGPNWEKEHNRYVRLRREARARVANNG